MTLCIFRINLETKYMKWNMVTNRRVMFTDTGLDVQGVKDAKWTCPALELHLVSGE